MIWDIILIILVVLMFIKAAEFGYKKHTFKVHSVQKTSVIPYIEHHTYCLYCYYPLHLKDPSKSIQCPHCGYANNHIMHKLFWTKEPRLVILEMMLKSFALIFCMSMYVVIFIMIMNGRIHNRWMMVFPIMFLIPLWQTFSNITRKGSNFRSSAFWGFTVGGVGLIIILVSMAIKDRIGGLIAACIFAVIVTLLFYSRRVFIAWRKRYLKRAQGRLIVQIERGEVEAEQQIDFHDNWHRRVKLIRVSLRWTLFFICLVIVIFMAIEMKIYEPKPIEYEEEERPVRPNYYLLYRKTNRTEARDSFDFSKMYQKAKSEGWRSCKKISLREWEGRVVQIEFSFLEKELPTFKGSKLLQDFKAGDYTFPDKTVTRKHLDIPGGYGKDGVTFWVYRIVIPYPDSEEKVITILQQLVKYMHYYDGLIEGCYIETLEKLEKEEKSATPTSKESGPSAEVTEDTEKS